MANGSNECNTALQNEIIMQLLRFRKQVQLHSCFIEAAASAASELQHSTRGDSSAMRKKTLGYRTNRYTVI